MPGELFLFRGKRAFVALYSIEEFHNSILILAIRHKREAGWMIRRVVKRVGRSRWAP